MHDSFWTHAASVDRLSQLLRQQFVDLHSQPLLPNLVAELKASKPDLANKLKPLPQLGKLDLNVVKKSVYFFA